MNDYMFNRPLYNEPDWEKFAKELKTQNKKLIKALDDMCRVHRHVYGLDGAWDKELTNAEQLLKENEDDN